MCGAVKSGHFEGSNHDARRIAVGASVKGRQKLHAHQAYGRYAADQQLQSQREVPEAVNKEPQKHEQENRGIKNLNEARLRKIGEHQKERDQDSLPDPESLSLAETAPLHAQALSHH